MLVRLMLVAMIGVSFYHGLMHTINECEWLPTGRLVRLLVANRQMVWGRARVQDEDALFQVMLIHIYLCMNIYIKVYVFINIYI